MKLVWIVLLNWNGWRDTIECLASVEKLDYPNFRVLVIDNASSNDSVAQIRGAFPSMAVSESPKNLGFAGGCNLGISHVLKDGADYVWLLNNDTIVEPSALRTMVEIAERESRVGAVGSVICDIEPPHKVQAWGGGRINLWFGRGSHLVAESSKGLDYITGASVLLRCEALKDVGLFDEGFFMYWEDADLCFRLRKAGWKLAVADESRVLHKESASLGKKNSTFDLYVWTSMVRFCRRHTHLSFIPIAIATARMITKRVLLLELGRALRLCQAIINISKRQNSPSIVPR